MNGTVFLMIVVLSSMLAASLFGCVLLLRRIQILKAQQNRWRVESRRWQELQGSFLSNMSHELRTPLTVIKGYMDLMKSWASRDTLDTKYRNALTIMGRNEKFLEDILNSILNYSKIKVGLRPVVRERGDIHAIFSDMLPALEEKAKKDLFFHVHIDPSVPTSLYFDMLAVRQIIRNLVENAVKFTSQGGITTDVRWTPPVQLGHEGEVAISIA